MAFLPITSEEVGGRQVDIVYVIGEAYVDHPSFGHAIVSRLLQSLGFDVAIIPQPQNDKDYMRFGVPKYGFMVSSGVVDSMVNNYTVAKIRRSRDVYSEGGEVGKRPDRCVDVYCNNLKRLYPDAPIVVGGIEASLRRFAHYDYWKDCVLPSILVSSKADLLIYGMGEKPIKEIFALVTKGVPLDKIRDVRGTCYLEEFDKLSAKLKKGIDEHSVDFSPSYEQVKSDKLQYAQAFKMQYANNDPYHGRTLLQKHGDKYVVQNPMQYPLSVAEMDEVYSLPYERTYHPSYTKGVPAIEEVKFSLTSVRGCFGACNYCAIAFHQGRIVQKRSKESIVTEAKLLVEDKDFKGYIHDVGGPTANFRDTACKKQNTQGVCKDKSCIGYKPCPALQVDHGEYLDLLRTLRQIEGIKKVFIRSGIRFDYVLYDKNPEFLRELIKHHVSGQLKVAPEHISDRVLEAMNKPSFDVYLKFKAKYDEINQKLGKKQYLVPYLISSHPACTLDDAIRLAQYLKSIGYMPEQVQDFYPTPSTKSTCMYYTEINPDTMKPVYVAKTKKEKTFQRALMQYRKKSNYEIIRQALIEAGREDLIGFSEDCLIKPTKDQAIAAKINTAKSGANRKSAKFGKEERGGRKTTSGKKATAGNGSKKSAAHRENGKPRNEKPKRGERR
ncbi:MAG: YgiQ family radical SAM protein [Clostridia bacterium]|nr:YgiQ family radical SAM protein [Clostridia bacterium]MDE7328408.1 YgiQ family radical SAM protein [Clostridia bacterium]